jgi:phage repressor protein C with HTH and peptisase S24 domain
MHLERMTTYRELAVDYLRLVMAETRKTPTQLAGLAGVSSSTFTRPLNNPDFKYAPKFETLRKLSQETGVALTPALTASSQQMLTPEEKRRPIGNLEVRGIVAAGVWREVFMQLDQPMGVSPFVENPTYSEFRQWAELVEGPSMNKHYLPGDFLHVVSTIDSGYAPKYGDHVIVERRDGNKIERTCKMYERRNGKPVLVGDSTDPRWNEPLPYDEGNGELTTVEIVGKVLGSYRPRPS